MRVASFKCMEVAQSVCRLHVISGHGHIAVDPNIWSQLKMFGGSAKSMDIVT